MRRPYARLAAAGVLAAAIAALTIGTAFAGGNPSAPGQEKKAATTSQSTSTSQSSSTQAGSPSQGGNGDTSQPGIKPANNTAKGTNCTFQNANTCTATSPTTSQSSAKADASKHYGNGKTAAQIAASRNVPAGSNIYGPGNSQPHKVTCPGSTKGPDVHAFKSGKHSCATVSSSTSSASVKQSSATQSNSSSTASVSNNTTAVTNNTTAVTSNTTAGTTSTGGVKAATTTLAKAKPKKAGHGGVLGTTARIRGGRLPFTGFPTWLAALLGIGMVLGGATLRARTQH